jgi:hypothetical protein
MQAKDIMLQTQPKRSIRTHTITKGIVGMLTQGITIQRGLTRAQIPLTITNTRRMATQEMRSIGTRMNSIDSAGILRRSFEPVGTLEIMMATDTSGAPTTSTIRNTENMKKNSIDSRKNTLGLKERLMNATVNAIIRKMTVLKMLYVVPASAFLVSPFSPS